MPRKRKRDRPRSRVYDPKTEQMVEVDVPAPDDLRHPQEGGDEDEDEDQGWRGRANKRLR